MNGLVGRSTLSSHLATCQLLRSCCSQLALGLLRSSPFGCNTAPPSRFDLGGSVFPLRIQHHCFRVAPPFAQPNQHSHHSPLLHPPHYPVSALVISIADCSTTSSLNLTNHHPPFVVAYLPSCAAASYQLHQISLLRQYQTALAASKIVLKSRQAPSKRF
ncbi:hypothetical protein PCASD_11058 [Puccinia coronata f. sp. avenae]|uniref:Uncharacterized protein n=1 Tax=Puccinia coronata f. sp. avenae TaxID=200324 RepID=A0A2N5U0I3_9BASI|nr:hypothetical protein PCASD_11058 [Puccinia coronata f. sp. avenae]